MAIPTNTASSESAVLRSGHELILTQLDTHGSRLYLFSSWSWPAAFPLGEGRVPGWLESRVEVAWVGVEGAAAWRVHPAPRVPRQASPLVVMICSGPFCSSMESLPGPCTIRSSRAPTVDRVGGRVRVGVRLGVGLGLGLG